MSVSVRDVMNKAISLGLNPGFGNMTDIIRRIQKVEGYEPCFRERKTPCPYVKSCLWADNCLSKDAGHNSNPLAVHVLEVY